MWNEAGLVRPWNDPDADFERALRGASSTVLLAEVDGRPVGTVMVGDDGHRGWIYYLAVDPGQQGTGVGRRLMAAAEAWLREQGCPKLQLMVRGSNEGAVAFYEGIGYDRADVQVLGRWLVEPHD